MSGIQKYYKFEILPHRTCTITNSQ
uniref:Uncharacterized protein n=1 Tax=Anguilla anguilla TaxID=7936 RepID=A0A0E9V7Y1_ANGAN